VHIETFLGKFMISQSPGGTVHCTVILGL